MFNRKEIKKEAKQNLKRHYLTTILLVFICSIIITGTYNYSTSNIYDSNSQKNTQIKKTATEKKSTYDIIVESITKKPIQKKTEKSKKQKLARGVLAPILNDITEKKSIIFGFVNVFNKSLFGEKVNEVIIMFICTLISLLITIFIKNVIIVGKYRYFLEQRRYDPKLDKLLFPFKIKKTPHLAYILFFKSLYEALWDLTIIGGFIKYYEYSMIPYILAENPTISKKEAFSLSKKLTKNEKWHLFVTDLSMIGWHILDILTLGLLEIFFTSAYKECIYAEIYMKLRKKINGEIETDKYLDIKEYNNKEYPEEKYLIKINKTRKWLNIDYNKNYSLQTYILFFFTFAMAGWIWEVFLNLLTTGHFANRGTMFGPWLPIYGFGIVFILFILKPFRKKPLKFFILTIILCGLLEYSTAWYLETFKHMKWWDYTGYFLNLHGRICFEGLLVFGLGGAAITYFLAPILNNIYEKINPQIKITICIILIILFGADMIYSTMHPNIGEGITDSIKK